MTAAFEIGVAGGNGGHFAELLASIALQLVGQLLTQHTPVTTHPLGTSEVGFTGEGKRPDGNHT